MLKESKIAIMEGKLALFMLPEEKNHFVVESFQRAHNEQIIKSPIGTILAQPAQISRGCTLLNKKKSVRATWKFGQGSVSLNPRGQPINIVVTPRLS